MGKGKRTKQYRNSEPYISISHSICVSCGLELYELEEIMKGLWDENFKWNCHRCSHNLKALFHNGVCPVCNQP